MLREQLDVHVKYEIFWTDSQVVLGYIISNVCQLKMFVANHVQQICDHTSMKQWHFIESGNNPADDASHGLDSKIQQKGGLMVHHSCGIRNCWLQKCEINKVSVEDPELKKVISVNSTQIQENSVLTPGNII